MKKRDYPFKAKSVFRSGTFFWNELGRAERTTIRYEDRRERDDDGKRESAPKL